MAQKVDCLLYKFVKVHAFQKIVTALFIISFLLVNMNASEVSVVLDEQTSQAIDLGLSFPILQQTISRILKVSDDQQLIVRPFNYRDANELSKASYLITENFKNRPEYKNLPECLLRLYLEANSPENLYQTMQKTGTFGYVVADNNDDLYGIVVARQSLNDNFVNLQIRRLHTSLSSTYKGIGKTLITLCTFVAKVNNIPVLMTTASMPARGFFEHLGWRGGVIQTKYELASHEEVLLPQFKCIFDIPHNIF